MKTLYALLTLSVLAELADAATFVWHRAAWRETNPLTVALGDMALGVKLVVIVTLLLAVVANKKRIRTAYLVCGVAIVWGARGALSNI